MLTLEKKLLSFIQMNPDCTLQTIFQQFSQDSSQWDLLALLASLEEQGEICCLQNEGEEVSFISSKTRIERAAQTSYKVLRRVADYGVDVVKTISGIKHQQNLKKQARIEKLEYLLDYEFDSFKCSHYQVELLLLKGHSLSDIAEVTGYSEAWLKQLAKAFNIDTEPAPFKSMPTTLPADAQVNQKLEALFSSNPI